MPNPAAQTPARFESYQQMMRYYNGIDHHGLKRTMTLIEFEGNEMYFERSG